MGGRRRPARVPGGAGAGDGCRARHRPPPLHLLRIQRAADGKHRVGAILPDASGFARGGSAGRERLIRIVGRAKAALREGDDPEARHALALVDLGWGTDGGKQLDAAISSLHDVAGLAERPAAALADLSAAYIVRAERAGAPRDLLSALEAAEEALEHSPSNRAARFNRALAIHRLGLLEEAAGEWRAYLSADSTSRWAAGARSRLREAEEIIVVPPRPEPGASEAEYSEYAAADPERARILGWDHLLGRWGEAVLAGDAERAGRLLPRVEAMGSALARRPGGDATLANAVRAIRRHASDRRRTRALAAAHREYALGRALYDQVRHADAIPHLAAAESGADGSPPLRAWARLYHGTARAQKGDAKEGEAILRAVIAAADPDRHPSLAGRARWSLASRMVRSERHEAALEQAAVAARLFARAGEREHEAGVLEAVVNARVFLRDFDGAYVAGSRALALLRSSPGSTRRPPVLLGLANGASSDGFTRAAIRVQDEGLRAGIRTGKPAYVAEAHFARARLKAAHGASAAARADVEAGRAALSAVTDSAALQWLRADLRLAEAVTTLRTQPGRAAGALDSAAALFAGRDARIRALPAVVGGAEARLAMGDPAGAIIRLQAAVAALEQRRDSVRMEPRRAAVFEAARGVVDRVAMLKLAAGRPDEALAYLDRARASLAPVGSRAPARAAWQPASPAGEVLIEYALIGDTLLAWTLSGPRLELHRSRINAARLARTVATVLALLEGPAEEREVRPALAELHASLIAPLQRHLGPTGTPLVIVADGELAAVPFAALHDARGGRYLIQDHPLRFAVSLSEARRRVGPTSGEEEAVLVADPAFDGRDHPDLQRLMGAADEARAIAREYPRAALLAGPGATRVAVEGALGRAGVFHYAGHAVFDDERPERSYLVLAPERGRAGSGRLTAAELAQLDLVHAPLVVLAACRTLRSGDGRAGGFSGLAGALLAAGARGAVGSLWEVDDRLTRTLMVEFHRAYRATGSGPGALRAAQLRLLGSRDPGLRSPSAWAGFRYAGS